LSIKAFVRISEVCVFANERRIGAIHSNWHDDTVENLAILIRLLKGTCIEQASNEVLLMCSNKWGILGCKEKEV